MASKLDKVMQTLVTVFNKYAGKEGDKTKLNKAEMKTLMQNELQIKEPEKVDLNGDGEVDFQEFVIMIAQETISCSETPKGQKQPAKNATDLGMAIQTLKDVFTEYASQDGNKDSLSKSEVKTLLQKELHLKVDKPKDLDVLMKDLDENGDQVVDFIEYIILFAAVTLIYKK